MCYNFYRKQKGFFFFFWVTIIALKNHTQFDEKKIKKSLDKRQILKAITSENEFIMLKDTQEYKEFQALDPETKRQRIEAVMQDIEKGAD